jgi:hypothetical protein
VVLRLVEEAGIRFVEGPTGQPLMTGVGDVVRVIEDCLSAGTRLAMLDQTNLTPGFFDLSTGDAGAVLQKLRNYRVRLAVVCPRDSARFSTRFGEALAEERGRLDFGVFETRDAARAWLALPPLE